MISKIVVEYTGPIAMGKREIGKHKKRAFYHIGKYWHEHFLPKHFTHAGAREYHYEKRKGQGETGKKFKQSYTGKKHRVLGHTLPLVYSGETRQRATQTQIIKANSKRVRVILRANKLNFIPTGGSINMLQEIRSVSDAENKVLQDEFNKHFQMTIERTNAKKKKVM